MLKCFGYTFNLSLATELNLSFSLSLIFCIVNNRIVAIAVLSVGSDNKKKIYALAHDCNLVQSDASGAAIFHAWNVCTE